MINIKWIGAKNKNGYHYVINLFIFGWEYKTIKPKLYADVAEYSKKDCITIYERGSQIISMITTFKKYI